MEQEHFEASYPEMTRFYEIEKIISFIKEGSSCQLLGIPGIGRSTVLSLLAHNRDIRIKHLGNLHKTVHFVVVNFSEIRKRPLFDAMKFLFLNLADSLRERRMDAEYAVVNKLFRENLSFNDELVLFQGLKQAIDFLALEQKITLVFLLDRFEEYVPTVTSELFTNLRTLRNRAKYQFSVVFSLNRPLESLLEPALLADFYEFVADHFVYMHLYDEATTTFRISSIEKITGKKFSSATLKEIIHLTCGHGKLTRLAVELVLANSIESKNLSSFLLSQRSMQAALMEIWRALLPAEQTDILQNAFDDKDVISYLEAVGVLKEKKIQIPLFAEFIQKELRNSQHEEQNIMYDQHTNTIKQGSVILSDQLTSSEFRLLRYLLQNPGRVVERNEIIDVVWEGVKSTAGITDQAVDQLIFRLRRKIEADPNNPVHLQTVKGRGFKFAI